ncbi:hypothetical protein JOF56_000922 [Kibdelosporangium banguiense]|uniref:Secreted protein n=1 Tax=Kibdelosporangium banguiense TaxID=1365924 RepID=A0ABS4T7Y8_9PSEU|nr:hypothetical protein [Kibdelosporangium banguiense]MBP2320537.1 hypothetical protein [Kibdelosporangium banguiense]
MSNKLSISARKAVAVAAIAAGAVVVLPAAQASAGETGGNCDSGRYTANFWLNYHTSGSYDYPDYFRWELRVRNGGQLGNRSNVNAKVKSVNSGGTGDPVHYEWPSADNIGPGFETHFIPNSVKVARNKSMYASYQFIFDKPGGSDPSCTGRTDSV